MPGEPLPSGYIPYSRIVEKSKLGGLQVRGLSGAVSRELVWGLRAVSLELRMWAERAARIPDPQIREDALDSIEHKRDHAHGAALFWTLPSARMPSLLRLLVAYQTIWDFLDNLSERAPSRQNGEQLHLALIEALDPGATISDYYRYHPYQDDDGYLLELVQTCQHSCAQLPSYEVVRPLILAGVRDCAIQALNHDPDEDVRTTSLRGWARSHAHSDRGLAWFELTAAASAFTPHPLLALAAQETCVAEEAERVNDFYFPWFALAIAMLDSYADHTEDSANEQHSYISYYTDIEHAIARLAEIVAKTISGSRALPNGHRHEVIAASMIAMYLSRGAARERQSATQAIAAAGGGLTRVLVPLLRGWRGTYLKRAAQSTSDLPPALRLPQPLQTFVFWRWPLRYLESCNRRYGSAFTLHASGHPPLVFISKVSDIKAILTAPADVLHPGEGASPILPLVGDQSFMLQEEQSHLAGRRAIMPAFSHSAVQRHTAAVTKIARAAVDRWPVGQAIALHPRLRTLTLQVILHSIFGASEHVEPEQLTALRERLLRMLEITASPVLSAPPLRRGPGSLIWKRFLRQRSEVDELIYALLDRTEEAGCARSKPWDLLALLKSARNPDGSPMSRRQTRDNIMSIILAGHETTASELTWAFQLLAHNPRVQCQLIEEIDNGDSELYLTATVQEVLRHRPVFLFAIPRAVAKATNVGARSYRPEAHLLGNIYLLHHNPAIYDDPHTFQPERFLGLPPDAHNWMPWGGGRKRCPGHHLATLEMKTVLRTVLARATVMPADGNPERPSWRSVIVTPARGGRVVLQARESSSTSTDEQEVCGRTDYYRTDTHKQNQCPYSNKS